MPPAYYKFMLVKPVLFSTELSAVIASAATLTADTAIPFPIRGAAADLCCTLAPEVHNDEALCAALMRAAFACANFPSAVVELLTAARATAPDRSKLIQPMLRLCRGAHEAQGHATVVVTLLQLAEIEAFDGEAPASWFLGASGLEGEGFYWLRQLLKGWVCRFGGSNEGVRHLIRELQDALFLRKNRFWLADHIRLHLAEPTAAGWIALARRRSEVERAPLALSFGGRHADAVATLQEALGRRHDPGIHVALERWLSELAQ